MRSGYVAGGVDRSRTLFFTLIMYAISRLTSHPTQSNSGFRVGRSAGTIPQVKQRLAELSMLRNGDRFTAMSDRGVCA